MLSPEKAKAPFHRKNAPGPKRPSSGSTTRTPWRSRSSPTASASSTPTRASWKRAVARAAASGASRRLIRTALETRAGGAGRARHARQSGEAEYLHAGRSARISPKTMRHAGEQPAHPRSRGHGRGREGLRRRRRPGDARLARSALGARIHRPDPRRLRRGARLPGAGDRAHQRLVPGRGAGARRLLRPAHRRRHAPPSACRKCASAFPRWSRPRCCRASSAPAARAGW